MRPTWMSRSPLASSGIGKWLLAASSTTFTPGAFSSSARASAGDNGFSSSRVIASEWARSTGTRMQVGTIGRSGMWNIFRISSTTLFSASL